MSVELDLSWSYECFHQFSTASLEGEARCISLGVWEGAKPPNLDNLPLKELNVAIEIGRGSTMLIRKW